MRQVATAQRLRRRREEEEREVEACVALRKKERAVVNCPWSCGVGASEMRTRKEEMECTM